MATSEPSKIAKVAVQVAADNKVRRLQADILDDLTEFIANKVAAFAADLVEPSGLPYDRVEELVAIRLANSITITQQELQQALESVTKAEVEQARTRWVTFKGKAKGEPAAGSRAGHHAGPGVKPPRTTVVLSRSSWADIGLALDMTPQGALKRYRGLTPPDGPPGRKHPDERDDYGRR